MARRRIKLSAAALAAALLAGCSVSTTHGGSCTPSAQPKRIDYSALAVDFRKPTGNDGLSQWEAALAREINAARVAAGLSAVPVSRSLTLVAGRHAEDGARNLWPAGGPPPGANMHSWSDVDYTDDHKRARLMWEAPVRLGTGYCAHAYEVSGLGWATPERAAEEYLKSPGHRAVILNEGIWARQDWKAMGVGYAAVPGGAEPRHVFHIWFGAATDPAGYH